MISVNDLWNSADQNVWNEALERYWTFVQPRNVALERSLETLNLERLRGLDALGWYYFLKDEYFRWKYTTPNRYASTTRLLGAYLNHNMLGILDKIRDNLLTLDTADIGSGLAMAGSIHGLGPAGASGLLSLMYPQKFGTVDQFLVKALMQVHGLAEATSFARMKPESLTNCNGVLLIGILRRKAADNNLAFKSSTWTPRKLDKVLWTYGR